MKILNIVQSIASDHGGLGVAALRFSQSLAHAGAIVYLYVLERCDDEIPVDQSKGAIRILGKQNLSLINGALALRNCIHKLNIDIIHIHGCWTPLLAYSCRVAMTLKIPYAVSPHGCVEPVALQHRKLKKKIALTLYQKRVFINASMIFATSKQELHSIRLLGLNNPIALIPNGVDVPLAASKSLRANPSYRNFLFLSRLHPIKGLPDLVLAWHKVRRPGWRIIIAGPDEKGHLKEVQHMVQNLNLNDDFDFFGLVKGERKDALFSDADVFVLPTYSENFGLAIAEALARGVPVITTTGAPWEDIKLRNCGWWVQPGIEGISNALNAAMDCSHDELIKMGKRGIDLIRKKYLWCRVGRMAFDAYNFIINKKNSMPIFIFTN